RNYQRHMTGSVYGIFDKPVHMWRGTTMAGIVTDESANNPKRGFTGGYEMETLSLGLPFMAAFLNPGAWGREFTSAMDGYANMAGMWLVGEDMPQETNRVTLHPTEKDRFGRLGVHDRRIGEPDVDHRHPGDPPGGLHRRPVVQADPLRNSAGGRTLRPPALLSGAC